MRFHSLLYIYYFFAFVATKFCDISISTLNFLSIFYRMFVCKFMYARLLFLFIFTPQSMRFCQCICSIWIALIWKTPFSHTLTHTNSHIFIRISIKPVLLGSKIERLCALFAFHLAVLLLLLLLLFCSFSFPFAVWFMPCHFCRHEFEILQPKIIKHPEKL